MQLSGLVHLLCRVDSCPTHNRRRALARPCRGRWRAAAGVGAGRLCWWALLAGVRRWAPFPFPEHRATRSLKR